MKTRIITAIAILAFVVPGILLGGIFTEAIILFFVAGGTFEFVRLAKIKQEKLLTTCLLALEVVGLYLPSQLILPYLGMVYMILLALPVFNEGLTPQTSFLCATFTGFFILLGNSFQETYMSGLSNVVLVLLITYMTDAFAYFVGRAIGKHKLNERVSPKKTIEGSIGGWVFGCLSAILFWKFFMPAEHFMLALLSGILLPIFGQLGDLAFSAIKRVYGIKDYSNLFPGHGGVLDRIDSLLFNLVCFYFIMMVVGL